MNPKFINKAENLPKETPQQVLDDIKKVSKTYQFRTNSYYQSLINWDDPDDPIKRLIIPSVQELKEWGKLDPSGEKNYTILPGLEHKYNSTALMLISNVCGGICRYLLPETGFYER